MLAALLLVTGLSAPAAAAPGDDDEGGTAQLRDQLDAATRGFVEAKSKLAASQQRQRELTRDLTRLERDLAARTAVVGEVVAAAYRGGRVRMVDALLDSDSPDAFFDRAATLDVVASRQSQQIRALAKARDKVRRARAAVAAEINQQRRQVEIMAVRKRQAERALELAGTGEPSSGPPASRNPTLRRPGGGSGRATPAPRNPDGSFPPESCQLNDPTTDGCITARTLHALRQAQAAGFRHHVSCHRNGGSGEHPKGRACDFAAAKNGFAGVATGAERVYGNNLADYFVRNADRLAVLYVIWFRQIWLPSSGWRRYGRAAGTPSTDHTNHVHLSVI
jgi:peptidoglycan DL-endopeptidase CwlO